MNKLKLKLIFEKFSWNKFLASLIEYTFEVAFVMGVLRLLGYHIVKM